MKRTLEDYNKGKWYKWGKNEMVCYDDGKPLRNMKHLNTDFVEPRNKEDCIGDFANCVHEDDGDPYICFNCEAEQIRKKYPKVRYTDDCEWVIPKSNHKRTKGTDEREMY
tara:strand:+ start:513 stop:842 length:330 start_codon:yes stop_codon:yes gene_type:complete